MAYNNFRNRLKKSLNPNAESFDEQTQQKNNTILSAESAEFDPNNANAFHQSAAVHTLSPFAQPQSVPHSQQQSMLQQPHKTLFEQHLQQQQMLIDAQLHSQMQQQQQQMQSSLMPNMIRQNTQPINSNFHLHQSNHISSMNALQSSQSPSKQHLSNRSLSLEIQNQNNENKKALKNKYRRQSEHGMAPSPNDIKMHKMNKNRHKKLRKMERSKYKNCRNEEFDVIIVSESTMNQNRQRLVDLNQTIQDHIRQSKSPQILSPKNKSTFQHPSLENLSKGVTSSLNLMSISKPPKLTKKIAKTSSSTTTNEQKQDNSPSPSSGQSQIKNIWASNLNEEMSKIEEIIEKYPYIAVDTEFPGVVARPVDSFRHWLGYGYRLVADNVNMLKLIQLGLTFYNEKGQMPEPYSTYQFNFKFNIERDMLAPDSIALLIKSGIDFAKLQKKGIRHSKFAEIMTMSGLVLNDDVRWICFHGSYDFAYLVRTLSSRNLPQKESEFFFYLQKYFPFIYDLKVLLRNVHNIKGGGLQKLANTLNVERIGSNHQAGSDSLLTGNVFFKLRELYFEELMDDKKYLNTLYGLGNANFAEAHNSWYFH